MNDIVLTRVTGPPTVMTRPSATGMAAPSRLSTPVPAVMVRSADSVAEVRVMVVAMLLVERRVPCRVAAPVKVNGPEAVVSVLDAPIVVPPTMVAPVDDTVNEAEAAIDSEPHEMVVPAVTEVAPALTVQAPVTPTAAPVAVNVTVLRVRPADRLRPPEEMVAEPPLRVRAEMPVTEARVCVVAAVSERVEVPDTAPVDRLEPALRVVESLAVTPEQETLPDAVMLEVVEIVHGPAPKLPVTDTTVLVREMAVRPVAAPENVKVAPPIDRDRVEPVAPVAVEAAVPVMVSVFEPLSEPRVKLVPAVREVAAFAATAPAVMVVAAVNELPTVTVSAPKLTVPADVRVTAPLAVKPPHAMLPEVVVVMAEVAETVHRPLTEMKPVAATAKLPDSVRAPVTVNEVTVLTTDDTTVAAVPEVVVMELVPVTAPRVTTLFVVVTVSGPFTTVLEMVTAAAPVLMAAVAEAVTVFAVRAKPVLDRVPVVRVTVVRAVNAVWNATLPLILRSAAKPAAGVHVAVPVPPMASLTEPLNAPVLTVVEPAGAIDRVPAAVPATVPITIAPEVITLNVTTAFTVTPPLKVMAPLPVLMPDAPVTVTRPVATTPRLLLDRVPLVNATVLRPVKAVCRTTLLAIVNGRAKLATGDQFRLGAAPPPRDSSTLPLPAPVVTVATADGAIDTVPAAEPLSAPVEMLPPADTNVKVTTAFTATLFRPIVVDAPDTVIEDAPVTVTAPVVPKFCALVTAPALMVIVVTPVSGFEPVSAKSPFTIKGVVYVAGGAQLTEPVALANARVAPVTLVVVRVSAPVAVGATFRVPAPVTMPAPTERAPSATKNKVDVAPTAVLVQAMSAEPVTVMRFENAVLALVQVVALIDTPLEPTRRPPLSRLMLVAVSEVVSTFTESTVTSIGPEVAGFVQPIGREPPRARVTPDANDEVDKATVPEPAEVTTKRVEEPVTAPVVMLCDEVNVREVPAKLVAPQLTTPVPDTVIAFTPVVVVQDVVAITSPLAVLSSTLPADRVSVPVDTPPVATVRAPTTVSAVTDVNEFIAMVGADTDRVLEPDTSTSVMAAAAAVKVLAPFATTPVQVNVPEAPEVLIDEVPDSVHEPDAKNTPFEAKVTAVPARVRAPTFTPPALPTEPPVTSKLVRPAIEVTLTAEPPVTNVSREEPVTAPRLTAAPLLVTVVGVSTAKPAQFSTPVAVMLTAVPPEDTVQPPVAVRVVAAVTVGSAPDRVKVPVAIAPDEVVRSLPPVTLKALSGPVTALAVAD